MSELWTRVAMAAIGGLTDVGFSGDGRYLLVVGHQGRGVFDRQTGDRVARDRTDDWSYFDRDAGTAAGIGPLDGQTVRVAGLMSGASLSARSESWAAQAVADGVVLTSDEGQAQKISEPEEVRVFGFDDAGGTFVLGTPSTVYLYQRAQ